MKSNLKNFKQITLKELLGVDLEFQDIVKEKGFKKEDGETFFAWIRDKNLQEAKFDYSDHEMFFLEEWNYKKFINEELYNLKKIFKDQIVVDLGTATNPMGYFLALNTEAKAYIGVDIASWPLRIIPTMIDRSWSKYSNNKNSIPYVGLKCEILSFLDASFKANQKFSFLTSSYGIYPKDESLFSNRFFETLISYINKTTVKGGGVFQNVTDYPLEGFKPIKKVEQKNEKSIFYYSIMQNQ